MRISDWSSDVCSSDLGSVLTENAMHSQILDGTRGAGMQRQTKCGGRRKGVVSGGVLATLVLATTCAAMAQGRPDGGTSESDHGPLLAQAGPTVRVEIAQQQLGTEINAFEGQTGHQVSVDH